MKKAYDAVATVGKYTDRQGNEKKRYVTVGAVFEDDQGRMSLKMDAVPCSHEWSGWISFYEPKEREQPRQQSPAPRQDAHNEAKRNGYQPQRDNSASQPDDCDDIPFGPLPDGWI